MKFFNSGIKAKTAFIGVAAAIAVMAVVLICSLSSCKTKLNFSATFYYVCYDSPTDAHSASSMSSVVQSYGGAGYVIHSGNKYYVTVSCYYSDGDADKVAAQLKHKGLGCRTVKVTADNFRLGGSARGKRDLYEGNLTTLLSLSKMCYELSNSLDNGCQQTAAKAVLSDVKDGLNALSRANKNNCFSREIEGLIAECGDVSHGYVLSRDTRRLQIALTDSIANINIY